MYQIIDQRIVERDYGFSGVEAIVDHPRHGRLLISDGFGGIDSLEGGAVRFEHGLIVKLHNNDTFGKLDGDWNERVTVRSAAINGYDDSRKVLEWPGIMISKLAASINLI